MNIPAACSINQFSTHTLQHHFDVAWYGRIRGSYYVLWCLTGRVLGLAGLVFRLLGRIDCSCINDMLWQVVPVVNDSASEEYSLHCS